ncbi:MAG: type IV pilus twitching motility protein PilT [Candidatus Xenobium sp.]|jgi:twitching motility protein PilT
MILDREAERVLMEWGVVHNALVQGASDLHFSAGSPPIARIHGELVRMEPDPITPEEINKLIDLLTDRYLKSVFYEAGGRDLDYTVEFPTMRRRFRLNVFKQYHGSSISMRVLAHRIQTFDELGLPRNFESLAFEKNGLVLVTGATGSGKSTTMAAMIETVNRKSQRHIITVEDPIEVLFENKRSMIEQREVGTHVEDFHIALRGALRQDPDIIFVGEIRDPETAAMTLRAAQVGALVLATLHTRSAIETVSRFLSFFDDNLRLSARYQLTDVIRGIMCQRLIPRRSGTGRVAAAEVLISNSAVKHIIREDRTHLLHSLMEIAASSGMTTMEESLLNRYHEGHIDLQTAFDNCNDKQAFISALPPELQKEVQMDWEVEIEIKRLEQLRETQKRQVQTRTL